MQQTCSGDRSQDVYHVAARVNNFSVKSMRFSNTFCKFPTFQTLAKTTNSAQLKINNNSHYTRKTVGIIMKGQGEAFAFALFLRLNHDPVSRQSAFTFSCIRPRIVEGVLRDLCNPRLSRANKGGSRPLRLYQLSSTYWKAETCVKSVPMSCIRGFNAALKRRRILRQQTRRYTPKNIAVLSKLQSIRELFLGVSVFAEIRAILL